MTLHQQGRAAPYAPAPKANEHVHPTMRTFLPQLAPAQRQDQREKTS